MGYRFSRISYQIHRKFPKFLEDLGKIKLTYFNPKVAIEAPLFIQNPRTTIQLSAVIYCVYFICHFKGLVPELIENTKWKKGVLEKVMFLKADSRICTKTMES